MILSNFDAHFFLIRWFNDQLVKDGILEHFGHFHGILGKRALGSGLLISPRLLISPHIR